jgi:hypothetical protein
VRVWADSVIPPAITTAAHSTKEAADRILLSSWANALTIRFIAGFDFIMFVLLSVYGRIEGRRVGGTVQRPDPAAVKWATLQATDSS